MRCWSRLLREVRWLTGRSGHRNDGPLTALGIGDIPSKSLYIPYICTSPDIHIYIYTYTRIFCLYSAVPSLGTRFVATPAKEVDSRAAKLEKLKQLQDAIHNLVQLRYLKNLKKAQQVSKATYGTLFAFCFHQSSCLWGFWLNSYEWFSFCNVK